jgi:hypothetical protein
MPFAGRVNVKAQTGAAMDPIRSDFGLGGMGLGADDWARLGHENHLTLLTYLTFHIIVVSGGQQWLWLKRLDNFRLQATARLEKRGDNS